MDLQELYHMQAELDEKIESQHNLKKEELVEEKTLALLVELGELANETRCFKFWSLKPASERSIILEEYVDGVHFLLSIGLTLRYGTELTRGLSAKEETLTDQFISIFSLVTKFKEEKSEEAFMVLFDAYVDLAEMLGFSWQEVEAAYLEKNKVNHTRQQQGY